MLHRLLLIAAATMCFAGAAAGAPYADREKGFTVEVPEGWTTQPSNDFPLDLALLSPRAETTGGVCLLMSQERKITKNMTQTELNAVVVEQASENFWRTILTSDKAVQVTDMTIKIAHETRGERTVGRASVSLTATSANATQPLQFEMMLQAVPGYSYMTHCAAKQDQVAAEAADIKTVIDTHTPTGITGVIASIQPPHGAATPVAAPHPIFGAEVDAFKASLHEILKRTPQRR
jgi:hypothetical protein